MYFITCFYKYEKDERGFPRLGSIRTFGYYPHKEWAIEDLHKNACDIREAVYNYAVVEKIPMGLYPLAEETIYFKWDDIKQGFYEIDPNELQDCGGNYAFG